MSLESRLIAIAKEKYPEGDQAHNFLHAERVLHNALNIAKHELKADLEILIPAALLHDIVTYAKNDPRNKFSTDESAVKARKILENIEGYPPEKISAVEECIKRTSFSKRLKAETIEQQILQDADMIEATSAIAIMRTFTSGGSMKRAMYHREDALSRNREPEDMKYSLDLFFTRLLTVKDRMNTKTGKEIAIRRTRFLEEFLAEFMLELQGK